MQKGTISLLTSPWSHTGWKHLVIASTLGCVAISSLLLLAACGDSGSGSDDKLAREVGSIFELGPCTADREGDTVFVKDKKIDYLCTDEDWVDITTLADGDTPSDDNPSDNNPDDPFVKQETVQDRSELSLCSVSGLGEEVLVLQDSLYFMCDGTKWVPDSARGYLVRNASITGAAIKGPFKFNSLLELRVLRLSNDSLRYSGNVYPDEISSNKGDFVIPKVNLVFPYGELVVRGQWQNEVSGQWSKDSLTLRALVDLSSRTEANVNLLTELEYDRAVNLVNNGYSVFAAKKQAQYEIMTAFGFATAIENAESLKMFVDSASDQHDANATLMAISLLFLGDRNDASVVTAIDSFKADFTQDGSWDDNQAKAAMADWAEGFDAGTIRVNVKSWNISDVPKFETYLNSFWNNVYGLGGCAKNRYGTITKNTNELSRNYDVHYICIDDLWRRASDYEKDTYQWTAGTKGEVKKGNVTDTYYTYNGSRWVVADRENAIGLCVGTTGVVKEYNGTYYICKSGSWTTATALEYDTYGWTAGTEGEVRLGSVNTSNYYVYENGAWRASANTIENNLGACVTSRLGEVGKSGNTYYTCKNDGWAMATALEYDTYGWTVGTEGEVRTGSVSTSNYYVYENGAWRASTGTIENNLGACVTSRLGEVGKSGNTYYTCKTDGWTISTALEYDTYGWTTGTEGEVRLGSVNTSNYYVYENGAWRASANTIENNLGACVTSRLGEVGKSGNTYYICKSNGWQFATALEYDTYGWGNGYDGEIRKGSVTNIYYLFNGTNWGYAERENEIGLCIGSTGVVAEYDGVYYICKSNNWREANEFEYDTYCLGIETDGTVKAGCVNTNNYYIYKSNEWIAATQLEYDTYCLGVVEDGAVRKGCVNTRLYYIYENGSWRASANTIENNLGACVTSRLGEVGKSGNTYYICKSNGWQMATTLEYDTYGKKCTKDGFIVNGNVSVYNKYVCDDEMFRAANAKEISLNKGCVSYTINAQIKIRISEALDSLYTCENNLWNGSAKTYYVQGSMADKRDNQTYKTVTIGMQKWMAQNLNYEYRLGMYSQSWCYNNSTNNCTKYGRLYTWAGAMDSAGLFTTNGTNCGNGRTCSPTYPVRGVCPEGWHLPKKSEIETLFTAIGGKATAGLMMKSTSGWFNNQNGLDAYSYSAIPAGYMNDRDSFKDNSFYANFWTASQYNSYSAYYMELGTGNGASLSDFGNKGYGFSIRCLQN